VQDPTVPSGRCENLGVSADLLGISVLFGANGIPGRGTAEFPRFDGNSNRGGEMGLPESATHTICDDAKHPSRVLLTVIPVRKNC
jgi:hypothetical protein